MVKKEIKEKQEAKKKDKDLNGVFIPGGLFVGMGFGFLYDQLVAGLFIGLGAGFLLYAVFSLAKNKK